MIKLNLTISQLLVVVAVITAIYTIVKFTIIFLYRAYTESQYYINSQVKKKAKIEATAKRTKKQKIYDSFVSLVNFVKWLDTKIPNRKQRKIFWERFIKEPQERVKVIEDIARQFAPEKDKK